ncbi:MAG: hypothetical protein JNJ73_17510 [Hyphomonadaceae bacterium]|nr:hypothetical protein [Hyphomonadaceae bacterium]
MRSRRSRFRLPRDREDLSFKFENRDAAWDFVRHLIEVVYALVGTPMQMVSHFLVTEVWRQDLLVWLAPAEKLARILLLAEAAELPRTPLAPPRPRARARQRRADPRDWKKTPSEQWSVSFAMFTAARARGRGRRGYRLPHLHPDALAKRFEALVRVALNPAPYAARLARRLWRAGLKRLGPLLLPGKKHHPMRIVPEAALHLAWRAEIAFHSGWD